MQGTITTTESSGRRTRHRSRRRKAAESIALIVGVPLLLAVVLALSVDLIEYHPQDAALATDGTSTGAASGASVRRMPKTVLEIPSIKLESDGSAR